MKDPLPVSGSSKGPSAAGSAQVKYCLNISHTLLSCSVSDRFLPLASRLRPPLRRRSLVSCGFVNYSCGLERGT